MFLVGCSIFIEWDQSEEKTTDFNASVTFSDFRKLHETSWLKSSLFPPRAKLFLFTGEISSQFFGRHFLHKNTAHKIFNHELSVDDIRVDILFENKA